MLLGMLWLIPTASAQDALDSEIVQDLNQTNYFAMGVSSEKRLKAAFSIYEQLIENGVNVQDFEVVVWGKVVAQLQAGTELADYIAMHDQEGIHIIVCQVAMKRLEVSEDDLLPGLTPVPNAFLRIYQLQANGYNTLIP